MNSLAASPSHIWDLPDKVGYQAIPQLFLFTSLTSSMHMNTCRRFFSFQMVVHPSDQRLCTPRPPLLLCPILTDKLVKLKTFYTVFGEPSLQQFSSITASPVALSDQSFEVTDFCIEVPAGTVPPCISVCGSVTSFLLRSTSNLSHLIWVSDVSYTAYSNANSN